MEEDQEQFQEQKEGDENEQQLLDEDQFQDNQD
jgi:hypothetical protein